MKKNSRDREFSLCSDPGLFLNVDLDDNDDSDGNDDDGDDGEKGQKKVARTVSKKMTESSSPSSCQVSLSLAV